jgi:hypothetical protein
MGKGEPTHLGGIKFHPMQVVDDDWPVSLICHSALLHNTGSKVSRSEGTSKLAEDMVAASGAAKGLPERLTVVGVAVSLDWATGSGQASYEGTLADPVRVPGER